MSLARRQFGFQFRVGFGISVLLLSMVALSARPLPVDEGIVPDIEAADPSGDDEPLVSEREKVELVADSNVAEAMNRRPDLNFSNVTIDGEATDLSLADIPADQVESANVSKAVTPDLDADLRGGGLILRSKPTYDLEERVLKGSLETKYYEVVDGYRTDGSVTYGKSLGRWGFIATASSRQGTQGEEEYEQDWDRTPKSEGSIPFLREQQIEHLELTRERYDVNSTVDFRLSDEIRLYAKADYRQSDRLVYIPRLAVRYDAGVVRNVTPEGAEADGARLERNLIQYASEYSGYTFTTGGYLDYEALSIDYQLAYNTWNYLEPEWLLARFIQHDVDLANDLSRERGPVFAIQPGSNSDLNAPEAYANDWNRIERWEEDNTDWVGTVNLKVPLRLDWMQGHFKTGLKLRGLDFFQDADSLVYDNYDGPFTLADVVGSYDNSGVLGGLYDHGPFPASQAVRDFIEVNKDRFTLNETRSREASDPASYDVQRDVNAGYAMLYMKFSHLKLIAGVRYEETNRSYRANELILDENGQYVRTNELTDANRYANWFPGIHGSFDIGRFSILGSWSNTIERPAFGIIVPFRNIVREERFIEAGNPGLQPTLYTNYDLSIDYRLGSGNLLSLELFYQTVEDIVYNEVAIVPDGIYAGYELESARNGPSADIYGFRLIWSQHLGDWLSLAEGLSLNAKYIFQESETEYPGRPGVVLPMPDRPENELELSLAYERAGIFLQVELNYQEASLDGINDNEPWRDEYEASHTVLNFSSSYDLTEEIRLLFEIDNVTNEENNLEYFGDGVLLSGYEYNPRTFKFGFRFDI